MSTAIEFNHISKQYRLGLVSTKTLSHDLNRWWQTSVLHKEDPYLTIGSVNDRSKAADCEYVWALRDIDFKVEQGDVVGIIGKNGAGKSTLLKLLSRVTSPTTGSIKAKGRIGSLLEVGTGFHPEMTGRENIFMNGAILGMTKQEIARKLDEIVDFSGCERYIDTPVKRYSSGMMVRLGFAVAAHLDPEILVVDEVLAVGDAEFQKKAIGKMQDVSQGEGRTVLFVSHNMDSIMNLCKRGILLEFGKVAYDGDVKTVVANYLGGDDSRIEFSQNETIAQSDLYISSVCFDGNQYQQKGLFSFEESPRVKISLKKKRNAIIDSKTVMSVVIMTPNRIRISNVEIPLADLGEGKTYRLTYKPGLLLPGKYIIRVVTHIPNISFYDRQDAVVLTISDNGTEFLKYNGADNGLVMMQPNIEKFSIGE